MLQYLVILLDETSTSYCHYKNNSVKPCLMPFDILREGIIFGMKENLMIQFVYPDYDLPQEYKDLIETIDHSKIMTSSNVEDADVVVFDDVSTLISCDINYSKSAVLRVSKEDIFEQSTIIESIIGKVKRLNIVITDIESFEKDDYEKYHDVLIAWSKQLAHLYAKGERPQLNILTDRIMLDSMNNCGAGDKSITLAPDGNFYVCPAFYHVGEEEDFGLGKSKFSIGSLNDGLKIKNPKLYELEFAPICRACDAFHCNRCVWLNRKMTFEINTPSKQQCVVSHIERHASIFLLGEIRKDTKMFESKIIQVIDYYDPLKKILKK